MKVGEDDLQTVDFNLTDMKFILGVKKNMTQVFDDTGKVIPVTVVEAGPVVVTQIKTKEVDGYDAVQIGFGEKKEKNLSKALKGHFKGNGNFRHVKEFRVVDPSKLTLKVGDKIDLSTFKDGDDVCVSSISKGKGFQGVIKRHGFKGQPRSHGQKHCERAPGSIGGGLRNKVPVGMRMAGRMGTDRITVKGLKVVQIDSANNELLISGAVAGRRGTLLEIVG